MTTADAVIIGGGLQGCSAALHLARRGLKPVVLEKNWCGRHASGVNAGGVRTLLRHPAEIPLALAARAVWHDIEHFIGDDCGYHTVSQVAVAETEADMDRLKARAAELAALGYDHEELIDAAELYQLVPALAPGCAGGLIARTDGFASPYHTSLAFKRRADLEGAEIREGVRATGIEQVGSDWRIDTDHGSVTAAAVLNCGGAWADWLPDHFGEQVPFRPYLPMMMVTARTERFLDPVVLGVGRPLSFKQMPNGTVLIGGGREASGDRAREVSRLDFAALAKSAATVTDLFPHMRGVRIVRGWAGFEGRMADDIPVIGPSRVTAGVFHAFGFSGHGFQLSPVIGRILAELVIDGTSSLPIEPFRIDRFADQSQTETRTDTW